MANKELSLDKAKVFRGSGFNIYGQGNFDLSLSEIAYIIDVLQDNNPKTIFFKLGELYDELSKTRMG